MRIRCTVLFLCWVVGSAAFASLDHDSDQLGLYFDQQGLEVCRQAGFATLNEIYLLYLNPTVEALHGFECSVTLRSAQEVASVMTTYSYATPAIDVGDYDSVHRNLIVGFGEPLALSQATVLASTQILYFDEEPLDIVLGPADPASLGAETPLVLLEDFTLMAVGISTPDTPALQINAVDCGVVATDRTAWDRIKAMYR
jgi:hypothetical protein